MSGAQERLSGVGTAYLCRPAGSRSLGPPATRLTSPGGKAGADKDEAPRRWYEQSVLQQVEVEYSDGRVVSEALRFVVVHSSQLAHQQTQTYAVAQMPSTPEIDQFSQTS